MSRPASQCPATSAAAAGQWVNVLAAYFGEIITPVLLPGAVRIAAGAALGASQAMFATDHHGAIALAAQSFAATLAGLVLPPGAATPPTAILRLLPGPSTKEPSDPAIRLSLMIHSWAITGLYVPNPTIPVPVPWS